MVLETIEYGTKITDDEEIEQILTTVESGDELTIEAHSNDQYRDNREVQFVDSNGHFQFGEPIADVGRVVKPEYQMIYELGDKPSEPLTNGMAITAVWVWEDE